MKKDENVGTGTIVQINPMITKDSMFAGCYLTVQHVKDFGVRGIISAPGSAGEGTRCIYYNAKWEEIEIVGQAIWIVK